MGELRRKDAVDTSKVIRKGAIWCLVPSRLIFIYSRLLGFGVWCAVWAL